MADGLKAAARAEILHAGFLYSHDALRADGQTTSLGHDDLVEALAGRLRHSSGGAILVSGFRGVGKTTLVTNALRSLHSAPGHDQHVVVARLNVSRPVTGQSLLFSMMRRLVEELMSQRILENLAPDVRAAIVLAYARTSLSLSQASQTSREREAQVSLKASPRIPKALGNVVPTVKLGSKSSRSTELASAFLAYTEGDAEYDLLKIVELLTSNPPRSRTSWWHVKKRARPIRLVVVLDELDKLGAHDSSVEAFGEILSSIKNVLSARGLHIVAITGVDVLDASELDAIRGNGIYESIFSWRLYVPGLWDSPRRLLDAWVSQDYPHRRALSGYLEFRSRGVSRRLLQEFNDMVAMKEGVATLDVKGEDLARLEFFAEVNASLVRFIRDETSFDRAGLSADRQRLACYFATDWLLRTEGGPFTEDDLLGDPQAINEVMLPQRSQLTALLAHLCAEGIIEKISNEPDLVTRMGPSDEAVPVFRLSETVRSKLRLMVALSDRERVYLLTRADRSSEDSVAHEDVSRPPVPDAHAEVKPSPALSISEPTHRGGRPPGVARFDENANWEIPRSQQNVGNGRYSLVRLLGAGGSGMVYEAIDHRRGDICAIKMLREPTSSPGESHLLTEARIGLSLRHEGIVRFREVFQETDGRVAIAMDLVPGVSLRTAINEGLPPHGSLLIAAGVLEALQHAHTQDVIRLDIKPENVVVRTDGRPVVVDLGLAIDVSPRDPEFPDHDNATMSSWPQDPTDFASLNSTATRDFVGTPRYMAPEQFDLSKTVDSRVDLFAVGLVMAEMLGAKLPQVLSALGPAGYARRNDRILNQLRARVSPELLRWVADMVSVEASARPGTARRAINRLSRVPEAAGIGFPGAP